MNAPRSRYSCAVCRLPMAQAILDDGFNTHPSCEYPGRMNAQGRRSNGTGITTPFITPQ